MTVEYIGSVLSPVYCTVATCLDFMLVMMVMVLLVLVVVVMVLVMVVMVVVVVMLRLNKDNTCPLVPLPHSLKHSTVGSSW